MAKGQKEALKDLLEAARALNGKFDVADEDLPLVDKFQTAAKEAGEALAVADKRAEKKAGTAKELAKLTDEWAKRKAMESEHEVVSGASAGTQGQGSDGVVSGSGEAGEGVPSPDPGSPSST